MYPPDQLMTMAIVSSRIDIPFVELLPHSTRGLLICYPQASDAANIADLNKQYDGSTSSRDYENLVTAESIQDWLEDTAIPHNLTGRHLYLVFASRVARSGAQSRAVDKERAKFPRRLPVPDRDTSEDYQMIGDGGVYCFYTEEGRLNGGTQVSTNFVDFGIRMFDDIDDEDHNLELKAMSVLLNLILLYGNDGGYCDVARVRAPAESEHCRDICEALEMKRSNVISHPNYEGPHACYEIGLDVWGFRDPDPEEERETEESDLAQEKDRLALQELRLSFHDAMLQNDMGAMTSSIDKAFEAGDEESLCALLCLSVSRDDLLEISKKIIATGIDVNEVDSEDYYIETTALTQATLHASPDSTDLLLQAGANPHHYQVPYGFMITAAMGRRQWSTLSSDSLRSRQRTVDVLLSHGVDINAPGEEDEGPGYIPLHGAALVGDAVLLDFVLLRGADPNQINGLGQTALDLIYTRDFDASLTGSFPREVIVSKLVDAGAFPWSNSSRR